MSHYQNVQCPKVLHPRADDTLWYKKRHQQNIQHANGVVTVMIAGQQYALVADYNWIVENFDYGNSNFAGQQLGGKIGIVKDPFGTPIYLGATTPIVGAALDKLSVTTDLLGNQYLYASLLEESFNTNPASLVYSWFSGAGLVWDVNKLIKAAEQAYAANVPNHFPLDLKPTPIPSVVNGQTVSSYASKLGAQPTKINTLGSQTIGWIYGMAAPEDNKEPTDGTTETHNGVTFIIQQPIDNQPEIPDMDFDITLEDEAEITAEQVDEAMKKFRESLIAPEGTEGISREEWIKQMTEATLEEFKKSGWLLSEPTSQFGNDFIEVAPHSAPDYSQNLPAYMDVNEYKVQSDIVNVAVFEFEHLQTQAR